MTCLQLPVFPPTSGQEHQLKRNHFIEISSSCVLPFLTLSVNALAAVLIHKSEFSGTFIGFVINYLDITLCLVHTCLIISLNDSTFISFTLEVYEDKEIGIFI